MGKSERMAYLKAIRERYRQADKISKSKILDEFCLVCCHNRKYAIRILNKKTKRRKEPAPNKRGIKPVYHEKPLVDALKDIWFACDQMCGKKLKHAIPNWLPYYEKHHGELEPRIYNKLMTMSAATIDRALKPIRAKSPRKGLSGTKPGSLLKTHIPIKIDQWDEKKPGFLEADTVAHCGTTLLGNFVWSLTMTDINTGWTENRATWNKGSEGVVHQIKDIEANLPFPMLGFDCDNGSEFLNHHLVRYFASNDVQFTRSRPYHKNDNAHVEQKNWTHVRQLFGYDRFEDVQLVAMMNDLYSNEWTLLHNHFYPSMKLVSKEKVNSKYYRRHSVPTTPYQRVMDSQHIADNRKQQLLATHQQIDPFELKMRIEAKLKEIFKLVKVTSNVRQRI